MLFSNTKKLEIDTLVWLLSSGIKNAFLCYRQQRVVVNGVKSDWAPVVSGVPQGTVLGPLLFSLHINDITADIESEIRLFADDCVCYLFCSVFLEIRRLFIRRTRYNR